MVNYFNEQSQIKLITLKENIKTLLQFFFFLKTSVHIIKHIQQNLL